MLLPSPWKRSGNTETVAQVVCGLVLFPYQVIALYDYDAQGDQELDLEEGDIVTVIAKEDEVWWCGQCKGKMGMFPSNYVEAYDEGM